LRAAADLVEVLPPVQSFHAPVAALAVQEETVLVIVAVAEPEAVPQLPGTVIVFVLPPETVLVMVWPGSVTNDAQTSQLLNPD